MRKRPHLDVSRRERQIMEIVYRCGEASVADVRDALPDPPSYSAVRAIMRLLEVKGHLKHKKAGRKYLFYPTVAPAKARHRAMRNLLQTFFEGSVEQAVASLLDLRGRKLTDAELDRLSGLIEQARQKGGMS